RSRRESTGASGQLDFSARGTCQGSPLLPSTSTWVGVSSILLELPGYQTCAIEWSMELDDYRPQGGTRRRRHATLEWYPGATDRELPSPRRPWTQRILELARDGVLVYQLDHRTARRLAGDQAKSFPAHLHIRQLFGKDARNRSIRAT